MGQSKPLKPAGSQRLPRPNFFDRDGLPVPDEGPPGTSSLATAGHDIRALKRSIARLPDQTALLDEGWRLLAVSAAWAREGSTGEIEALKPGDNFRLLSRLWAAEGQKDADLLLAAVDNLSAGRTRSFHHVFAVSDRPEEPQYAVTISRLDLEGRRFFTITRFEVSKLNLMAERCRELEKALLQAREVERQRIGRELHDSTSQLLVGLKICLMRLKEADSPAKASGVVDEMDELLLDIDQEIRSISFLLHPPRLRGRGLPDAIRYMVRGFARRSGLKVSVDVEGNLPARIPEVEATLYRLAQEALANVHRHAAATLVKVRLVTRGAVVHLLVEDNGIGRDGSTARTAEPGVGIEGMASRVLDLGGRFSFRHLDMGSRLLASIPTPAFRSRLEVG